MAWDDWVFGALTGGAYNVGKTIYEASEAADKAGDAAEEIGNGAGTALAVISSTVNKLGKDMSSFLKEMEQLLTVRRVTPRDEVDLWDEEVERLDALRQHETQLLAELAGLEKSDDDDSWFEILFDSFTGNGSYEELILRTKLAVVRSAITEILCEEPGVIPTSIHNVQLILERFNTLEQPRLEEILDSANDNLEESKEILSEVHKLFVTRTWKAVLVSDLTPEKRRELESFQKSLLDLDSLIEKNAAISSALRKGLVQAHTATFPQDRTISSLLKTGEGPRINVRPVTSGGSAAPGGSPDTVGKRGIYRKVLPSGPSFSLKSKVSVMATQPMASSIASALNMNAVSGYLDNYHVMEGRNRFYLRERLKIEKAIYRIKWIPVDEPGVIPRILGEFEQTISRFRIGSQPRIEAILDNVNAAAVETKAILSNVNISLGFVQRVSGFLSKYSLYIKIGLAAAGGLILLILFLCLIALLKYVF